VGFCKQAEWFYKSKLAKACCFQAW